MAFTTLDHLAAALHSPEFREDAAEYLFYGARLKLERFLTYSLSKVLNKSGQRALLEVQKVDLTLNGDRIEFKFHYDFDLLLPKKLPKELREAGSDLAAWYETEKARPRSKGWGIAFGVLKDILDKPCDVFVWIISERDFDTYRSCGLDDKTVGFWNDMAALHPLRREGDLRKSVDEFSSRLQPARSHRLHVETVSVTTPMISHLHVFLFNFRQSG